MDTWTALILSRQTSRELRRNAARHRLATLAAASARTRRDSTSTEGRSVMAVATEHLEQLPVESSSTCSTSRVPPAPQALSRLRTVSPEQS
jgi:hypothetical protein